MLWKRTVRTRRGIFLLNNISLILIEMHFLSERVRSPYKTSLWLIFISSIQCVSSRVQFQKALKIIFKNTLFQNKLPYWKLNIFCHCCGWIQLHKQKIGPKSTKSIKPNLRAISKLTGACAEYFPDLCRTSRGSLARSLKQPQRSWTGSCSRLRWKIHVIGAPDTFFKYLSYKGNPQSCFTASCCGPAHLPPPGLRARWGL